jgi:hypothetical protein
VNGVYLSPSHFLPCSKIICGTNLLNLVTLLGEKSTFTRLGKLIQHDLKPEVEFIFLFLGFRKFQTLPRHNVWHIPENSGEPGWVESYMSRMTSHERNTKKNSSEDTLLTEMPVFLASGSAKENPSGVGNTLVAITYGRTEWFTPPKEDEVAYAREKQKWESRLLHIVLLHFPHLKEEVEWSEVATPLTYSHYMGTQKGEAYGLAMNCDRYRNMDMLHPETELENLYCTGQDICTLGLTGALHAGLMTATRIHGLTLLFRLLLQTKPHTSL